jgi:peptidoglycan/xylan/chitin deacetylase (PgdA/CDA1 family)
VDEPLVRRVVAGVSRGVGAFRHRSRPGLRILMYHALGDGDRHSVAADRFAGQMQWLREASGLTVSPLIDAATSPSTTSTAVALTFDDGFRTVLTLGVPVLARYGLPFTVFVVGEYVQSSRAVGQYLDPCALRELAAVPGVTIGAHGYTHCLLTRLGDLTLEEELRRSIDVLSDILGRRPEAMSYPHGAVDHRVARAVGRAGFAVAATSLHGVNRPRTPPLRLRRTEIDAFDDDESFAGKVHGDYDWYQLKQRLYWPAPAEA